MIAQNKSENKDIRRTATIIYLLKLKGITQTQIADELQIKKQVVNNVINGRIKSRRVTNWIKDNLGI